MAAILMTICGVGFLIPFIYLRIRQRSLPAILLKIAASVFFLLTACAGILALSPGQFGQYKYICIGILAGQICGLLGDYWLDMKDMYPQHKEPYMFAGFSSFLVGHLFFIAGLVATYGMSLRKLLISLAAGIFVLAFVIGTEKPMKLQYGKFKGITAGYTAVFGFVVALSLLHWIGRPGGDMGWHVLHPQALVMNIGLVIFLLSDLVLSGTYFGKGKDRPVDIALNYIFYYGGQFTIALSLLALR